MNIRNSAGKKQRGFSAGLLILLLIPTNGLVVFGHGGEDHGDAKPQTQTNTKGTVSKTSRLGSLELLIKYNQLEPDAAAHAQLFVTRFDTNEAVDAGNAKIEIESADGSITEVPFEKATSLGSYVMNIPALPEGAYTLRAKLDVEGKSNTATFSGVRVEHPQAEISETGMSVVRIILMLLAGSALLAMFAGLFYFVWRFAGNTQIDDEAVAV